MYKKPYILIIIIFIVVLVIPNKQVTIPKNNIQKVIEEKEIITEKTNTEKEKEEIKEIQRQIGILEIPKINLKKELYDINSPLNNIEKNVTILKETISQDPTNNGLIVLAAHSGNSYKSFFDDLDKLIINDTIKLTYKNNIYEYKVIKIYEQEKNGYINITTSIEPKLFLTTCSKNYNKQLIIECKLK